MFKASQIDGLDRIDGIDRFADDGRRLGRAVGN
jgi:hypothetical protein